MNLANQEFLLMVAIKRSFLFYKINKEPHFALHCVAVATVIKENQVVLVVCLGLTGGLGHA